MFTTVDQLLISHKIYAVNSDSPTYIKRKNARTYPYESNPTCRHPPVDTQPRVDSGARRSGRKTGVPTAYRLSCDRCRRAPCINDVFKRNRRDNTQGGVIQRRHSRPADRTREQNILVEFPPGVHQPQITSVKQCVTSPSPERDLQRVIPIDLGPDPPPCRDAASGAAQVAAAAAATAVRHTLVASRGRWRHGGAQVLRPGIRVLQGIRVRQKIVHGRKRIRQDDQLVSGEWPWRDENRGARGGVAVERWSRKLVGDCRTFLLGVHSLKTDLTFWFITQPNKLKQINVN